MKYLIVLAVFSLLTACGPKPEPTSYDAYKPAPPPTVDSPEAPKPHVGLIF